MKFVSIGIVFSILISACCLCCANALPYACGDEQTTLAVNTLLDVPATHVSAADRRALIVFIEAVDRTEARLCLGCDFTARVGMDGAWMGATTEDAFFVLAVEPGTHHLCANWQSVSPEFHKKVGTGTFCAEAGKVYYFETKIAAHAGQADDGSPRVSWRFQLRQTSKNQARYRMRFSALSTAQETSSANTAMQSSNDLYASE